MPAEVTRFPPPWTVDEGDAELDWRCFIVRDANGDALAYVSTPEQKCIGWPEQKYISDASRMAPKLGSFVQASGLGRIIYRRIRARTV